MATTSATTTFSNGAESGRRDIAAQPARKQAAYVTSTYASEETRPRAIACFVRTSLSGTSPCPGKSLQGFFKNPWRDPQKALCGGRIPDPYLEPLTRTWSHFVGIYRRKLTRSLKNHLSNTPTKGLAWYDLNIQNLIRGRAAQRNLRIHRERERSLLTTYWSECT